MPILNSTVVSDPAIVSNTPAGTSSAPFISTVIVSSWEVEISSLISSQPVTVVPSIEGREGSSPNGISPDGMSPDGISPDGISPDGISSSSESIPSILTMPST